MIEYLKYFFNPAHLFTLRPGVMRLRAIIILAVIFGVMITAGIIIKLIRPKIKDGLKLKAYRRLFHLFLTMGIIGLVYLFFAWQGVALLAGRFWLIIMLVVVIIWLGFIAKYLFLEIPKLRKSINQKRDFEKYIP